jgi:hypothetical protein
MICVKKRQKNYSKNGYEKRKTYSMHFKAHRAKKSFDQIIVRSHYKSFSLVFVDLETHGDRQAPSSIFVLPKMLSGP